VFGSVQVRPAVVRDAIKQGGRVRYVQVRPAVLYMQVEMLTVR
jgi:hypothetical protein